MTAPASQPDRIVRHPPLDKPLLIYDADCNFCRRWIARWNRATGDRVAYAEYQKVEAQFPEIPRAEFEAAVQLIELNGRVLSGADAVFRIFDFAEKRGRLLRFLRRLPGFMPRPVPCTDFIASHRTFFSRISP